MDADLLNMLKPSLPLLCEMHRLCSLARFTYSEFGLTFDSNVTARYAARMAELEAAGTHPVAHFHTLPFSTFIPITASRSIPRRRLSLLVTRCHLPPGPPPLRSNDYL